MWIIVIFSFPPSKLSWKDKLHLIPTLLPLELTQCEDENICTQWKTSSLWSVLIWRCWSKADSPADSHIKWAPSLIAPPLLPVSSLCLYSPWSGASGGVSLPGCHSYGSLRRKETPSLHPVNVHGFFGTDAVTRAQLVCISLTHIEVSVMAVRCCTEGESRLKFACWLLRFQFLEENKNTNP